MRAIQTIAFCIVVLAFAAATLPSCYAIDAVDANLALTEAESKLNVAFESVAEAEAAGANTENLLSQIKVAGDLISEAHFAFRAGDYETAVSLAAECSSSIEGLVLEAVNLTSEAEEERLNSLILTVAGSGTGLVLLIILGIVGWSTFAKSDRERLLKMKPEVEESQ